MAANTGIGCIEVKTPSEMHPEDFEGLSDDVIENHNELLAGSERVEVNNKVVYQNDKLINPNVMDETGRSNVTRMEEGLAPIGEDGKSLEIHHITRSDSGAHMEITATNHRLEFNYKRMHMSSNNIPSQINMSEFNQWKDQYWNQRATEFK